MDNRSFLRKVLAGTVWLSIGTTLSKLLLFISSVVLINIFSKQQFGEYSMIKSTIDNFLVISSAGIGITTTKYVAQLVGEDKKERVRSLIKSSLLFVVVVSSVVCLALCLSVDYLIYEFLKHEELKYPLIFGSISLVFLSINAAQLGALIGLESHRSNAIATVLQGFFVFAGYSIGGYVNGVSGAFVGYTISIALLTIIINFLLRYELNNSGFRSGVWELKNDLRSIVKFAIPASLGSLVSAPFMWLINATLVEIEDGYTHLALYSSILLFSIVIQMLNASLSNSILPILLKTKNTTAAQDFVNYFGSWMITVFISLPLLFFPEIVWWIIGAKYSVSEFILILGLTFLSTFIISNKTGIARDLVVQNKMWISFFSIAQSVLVAFFLFKYYWLEYKAVGLALSFAVAYIINYLIFVPLFIRLKISPSFIFYNIYICFIWLTLFSVISVSNLAFTYSVITRAMLLIVFGLILVVLFLYLFKYVYFIKGKNISQNVSIPKI